MISAFANIFNLEISHSHLPSTQINDKQKYGQI